MNINGDLILAGNLLPAENEKYDIGSSSKKWRQVQAKYLSVGAGDISAMSPNYKLVVSGDTHITGYSIFDDYVNIGTSGQNTYKLYVNGKTYLNGQTTVYKDFIIKGNESTNDSTHLLFNASDNSQRAIITWNGNVDNTFNSSTHLKIATSYGDIKILAASGNVDFGDGNRSLIWRKSSNVESGVYYHTTGRESVVFANVYQHTGWIFANGIRPSARTQWNALGVTPALQIHHNAIYVNRPVRDADTADYNLYVNGNSNLQGSIIFSGDLTAFYDSADQYLSYTAEGSVSNHAGKLSLYRIIPSGTSKVAGTKILGAQLDAASGLLHLQAAGSNPSATAGARIKFTYYNSSSDQGQAVYISSSVNDSYRDPYGIKIWGDVGTAPGAWLEVEGNLYIGSASNANSNNNSALYIRGMSAIEGYDNWLRLNDNSSFTSGTYSPKLIRSDEALQVGSGGANFYANNSGNGYFSNTLGIAGTNTGYKLYVNGTSYFNGDISGAGNIYPITNNSKNLGSSTLKWANAYATTFHGSLDGNAATATKLATARSITIGSASKTFDGTANISYTPYEMKLVRALYSTDSNLNSFANRGHALGMCSLADNGSIDNPGGKTGWHHVINLTWADTADNNNNTANEWCTQIANACGSSDLYVRSRSGGSITNGTAWTAPWTKILTDANYGSIADNRYVKKSGDTMTGNLTINNGYGFVTANTVRYGINAMQYFNVSTSTTSGASTGAVNPTNDWYHHIRMNHANSAGYYVDLAWCFHSFNAYMRRVASGTDHGWKRIWIEGNAVTGAVWNDYAECRQADTKEAGYVLTETGFDNLTKTTKRLQHFAGVSSDTWGFSQGETEKAKTPIAVAGRVLVYTYQNRNNYKPGDCVCAAPGGTVDIMTRKEIIKYPDRIVGTVSCVPEYEEWGGGEGADRDPVKVNGRIWIKVK